MSTNAEVSSLLSEVRPRVAGRECVPVPYCVTVYGVTFTGVLYIREPLEDTTTDGVMSGGVNGNYHADKHNGEIWVNGTGTKAGVRLDFAAKRLYADACAWNPWPPWDPSGWECNGWVELAGG